MGSAYKDTEMSGYFLTVKRNAQTAMLLIEIALDEYVG